MAKDTDKELVRRVQKGDRHAFDLLFSRYQHKILNLVSRYLRDREDVEDVAQEAFIKAFRALPRFRGESAFYTWLYRIAINTAKNHLVARSRRPPGIDVDNGNTWRFARIPLPYEGERDGVWKAKVRRPGYDVEIPPLAYAVNYFINVIYARLYMVNSGFISFL